MPVKLSVAHSRKIGEANFGSRGATVGLELEIDANIVDRPDELRSQIERLFCLARESVERELLQSRATTSNGASYDGSTPAQPRRVRSATFNQLRAIRLIAADQGIDLSDQLRRRFGLERLEELSIAEASDLIDALKAVVPGNQAGTADERRGNVHSL